jgi:hypothetical protein
LGDRKSSKPECRAAAHALSFALRWSIPIISFPVGFICSVGNSRFQSSFFFETGEFDFSWFGYWRRRFLDKFCFAQRYRSATTVAGATRAPHEA